MRIAYLDLFSGVSGDMLLGALLHAGLPLDRLRAELAKLGLPEFEIDAKMAWRDAMEGIKADVILDKSQEPPHRGLSDVKAILAGSALEPSDKERAIAVFTRLAAAEAKVHGCSVDEVHFHEVGAVDAIVDVVGTVAGLRCLGVEELYASAITLGRGTVDCAHGKMPVPVPATLELVKGVPVVFSDLEGELVTPTGAALVTTLATRIGPGLDFTPGAIGYGFGTRVRKGGPPNAVRIVLGERSLEHEEIYALETNLDDSSGEIVGWLIERALAAGALDAYAIPIQMKKSRPGLLFCALAEHSRLDQIERLIFAETATLGVRRYAVRRSRLERVIAEVATSLGKVRVKFARGPGVPRRAAPEYDDVARIAAERQMPLRLVLEVVNRELPPWPAGSESGAPSPRP
jgi:uncharacterized protein (TIGR00299 family) protein